MTEKLSRDAIEKLMLSVDVGRAVLEKLRDAHDAAQAELDQRASELRPEILEHFKAETRAKFAAQAEAALAKYMGKKRDVPAEQRALYDPEQLRRTARLHPDEVADAQLTSAFLARLAIAPPARLVEIAQDAAERGDFARAALLEDYIASRGNSIGNDIVGAVETALKPMAYNGPEAALLDEMENLVFESEQLVSLVKTGARKYTTAQFEAMSQEQFESARRAQQKAGINQ